MTTPTKTLLATGVAAVVAGCSTKPLPKPVSIMPPVPVVKNVVRTQRTSLGAPQPMQQTVFPINYPTNINPSNYSWKVLVSTNLVYWQDKPFVIIDTTNGCDYQVWGSNKTVEYYRLTGTPH